MLPICDGLVFTSAVQLNPINKAMKTYLVQGWNYGFEYDKGKAPDYSSRFKCRNESEAEDKADKVFPRCAVIVATEIIQK